MVHEGNTDEGLDVNVFLGTVFNFCIELGGQARNSDGR